MQLYKQNMAMMEVIEVVIKQYHKKCQQRLTKM